MLFLAAKLCRLADDEEPIKFAASGYRGRYFESFEPILARLCRVSIRAGMVPTWLAKFVAASMERLFPGPHCAIHRFRLCDWQFAAWLPAGGSGWLPASDCAFDVLRIIRRTSTLAHALQSTSSAIGEWFEPVLVRLCRLSLRARTIPKSLGGRSMWLARPWPMIPT